MTPHLNPVYLLPSVLFCFYVTSASLDQIDFMYDAQNLNFKAHWRGSMLEVTL